MKAVNMLSSITRPPKSTPASSSVQNTFSFMSIGFGQMVPPAKHIMRDHGGQSLVEAQVAWVRDKMGTDGLGDCETVRSLWQTFLHMATPYEPAKAYMEAFRCLDGAGMANQEAQLAAFVKRHAKLIRQCKFDSLPRNSCDLTIGAVSISIGDVLDACRDPLRGQALWLVLQWLLEGDDISQTG
jgi:hypothetical protein